MKIALVRYHDACLNTRQIAALQRRAGVLPHLGLGYIHTALKRAGHEVVTLDAPALQLTAAGLKHELEAFRAELVGVTTTTPGIPGALDACRVAKSMGARVILGGPHTEVFAKENLYHDFIDYVGVGEGATVMPALAAALERGEEPDQIPGLVTRYYDGGIAPMLNLEAMGWPERESLPMHNYHSIMAKHPFATMISSRGCPFQCSFCFKQDVDRKSIFRSPEDVVAEMIYLKERWKVREIMFYDDIFTMKKSRVYEICALIRQRGLKIRWEAPTRVDLVDENLLQEMAKAGCVRLRFGIESGDEEILKRMKKESDLAVIESAVRTAKKVGIQTFAYFIVGYLGETTEQYQSTVKLALDLPLDYATFYTATPLPGTTLHAEAVRNGTIPEDYWLRYVRGETSERIGFLVPEAEGLSRAAYRRFYFRRSKARTILKHMGTSNMFMTVLSGLGSLMVSRNNIARDM